MSNTSMTLQELFEIARDNAKTLFETSGVVVPMWHAIAGDDEHALIITPWGDEQDKDETVRTLRKMFAVRNVKRFAFITEAWSVQLTAPANVRPSEHPDRREMLRVHAEDRDGRVLGGGYFILRPEHGPAKLSPFRMDESTEVMGRMVGLLT